jgi:hypothetical protein
MNRDERVARGAAAPPERVRRGAATFLAPRDADAGGTWIAVDPAGRTLCLMNGDRIAVAGAAAASGSAQAGPGGAAEPAQGAEPPSRGWLIPELMEHPEPDSVERELRGRLRAGALRFRPFELVVVAASRAAADVEARALRFDGRELTVRAFRAPFLLASNGLDPDGVARARRARFESFLAERAAALEAEELRRALFELHASHAPDAPDGGLHTICMHRPEVRTVSATLVEVAPRRVAMLYRPGPPCLRAPAHEVRFY